MLILALDVATRCGFARGEVGAVPSSGSVAFGGGGNDRAVFAAALSWLSELLEPRPRPDWVILEALLPGGAMKGETQRATRDRLAGLRGVMLAVAQCRGIKRVSEADVADVRSHFISTRKLKRAAAKAEVLRTCARLGWAVADDDAGDACALWSYACAQIDPTHGIRVSPLFQRGVAL
jgi:hypothetical protein